MQHISGKSGWAFLCSKSWTNAAKSFERLHLFGFPHTLPRIFASQFMLSYEWGGGRAGGGGRGYGMGEKWKRGNVEKEWDGKKGNKMEEWEESEEKESQLVEREEKGWENSIKRGKSCGEK